jgi:outer membrane protein assembly factor BamE (lipoprotein component of BamABCDE complex)
LVFDERQGHPIRKISIRSDRCPWGAVGLVFYLLIVSASGCANNKEKMVRDLDLRLSGLVGKAHRQEIIALLGEPGTVDDIGQVEVWVYQFSGTGSKKRVPDEVKEVINYCDELIMTFDSRGVLQKYTLALMGQGSKKGRH